MHVQLHPQPHPHSASSHCLLSGIRYYPYFREEELRHDANSPQSQQRARPGHPNPWLITLTAKPSFSLICSLLERVFLLNTRPI